jgi:WD40 repeat protein
MKVFENENLLGLIYNTLALYSIKQLLTIVNNKTLFKIILKQSQHIKGIKSYGKSSFILNKHVNKIMNIAFISDKYIVSIDWLKCLKVWSTKTNQCIKTIEDKHITYSVCVLPDNNIIYSSADKLKVLNTNYNFTIIKTITMSDKSPSITGIYLLSNNYLACTSVINKAFYHIFIIDCNAGYKLVTTIKDHTFHVNSIVNLAKNRFASGSSDMTVKIWNLANFKRIETMRGHTDKIVSLLSIEKENLLLSGSHDKAIVVWDSISYGCIRIIVNDNPVNKLLLLPDGYFVSNENNCDLHFFNIKDLKRVHTLTQEKTRLSCFILLRDNRIAYTTKNYIKILNC